MGSALPISDRLINNLNINFYVCLVFPHRALFHSNHLASSKNQVVSKFNTLHV